MAKETKNSSANGINPFKKFLKNPQTLPIVLSLVLILVSFLAYESIFINSFVPGVFIGNDNVSFLTKNQAYQLLQRQFNLRSSQTLQFGKYSIDLKSTSPEINYSLALDKAFALGHTESVIKSLTDQSNALFYEYIVTPEVSFSAQAQIDQIAKQVDIEAQNATIWLDEGGRVNITPGTIGKILDKKQLNEQIKNYLTFGTYSPQLPIKNADPDFTDLQAQKAKKVLENIQKQPVVLTNKNQTWNLDLPTLFFLLDQNGRSVLDEEKLKKYVGDIAMQIDVPVREPLFKFDSTSKKVEAFQPAQDGQALDTKQTRNLILDAIQSEVHKNITLPVKMVTSKYKTAEINNLGIKELLGKGESHFAGSIPNRIYNIGLTASKLNGILIPPGSIFSFNGVVGDISAATGFKQAYVIKEGRTVLGDGGGVCQDSTTLFRAVLGAGLPIVQRTAHAYRVGYYEQGFPPGIDATVYYPSVDFQFKNDTPAYILIQAYTVGTSLTIDLYGTSDGRVATLTTPVISSQTPPPPELRQDDPTLPRGSVKQVDFAAWGARVAFDRTVTRNGESLIQETWRSNYKPWQAIYLVGTKN